MSYWDYKFYIIYLVFLNHGKKYLNVKKPKEPEQERERDVKLFLQKK